MSLATLSTSPHGMNTLFDVSSLSLAFFRQSMINDEMTGHRLESWLSSDWSVSAENERTRKKKQINQTIITFSFR